MNFTHVLDTLNALTEATLPGADAQALMAPLPRREWPQGFNPARIRNAAGLLVVYPHGSATRVVLTVRADTLGRHGGQVSLPGGVVEPGESFEQAALREAHEEISLPPDEVRPVGPLTPVDIIVSGFRLHPIVAVATTRPPLSPSDGEVARILHLDVSALMQPSAVAWRRLEREGRVYDVPAFIAADAEIWGATAMVLAEFLAILGWTGPRRGPPAR